MAARSEIYRRSIRRGSTRVPGADHRPRPWEGPGNGAFPVGRRRDVLSSAYPTLHQLESEVRGLVFGFLGLRRSGSAFGTRQRVHLDPEANALERRSGAILAGDLAVRV